MLIIDAINPNKPEQIFSKITFSSNGCWLWNGSLNKDGYGYTSYKHKTLYIHRFMYAWLVSPIPDGKGKDIRVLDHLCNNRNCCNPAHLILVSPRENVMRTDAPPALNYKKDTCKRGHKLSPRHPITGRRRCYECSNFRRRLQRLNVS